MVLLEIKKIMFEFICAVLFHPITFWYWLISSILFATFCVHHSANVVAKKNVIQERIVGGIFWGVMGFLTGPLALPVLLMLEDQNGGMYIPLPSLNIKMKK